jgi:hypothetical protein
MAREYARIRLSRWDDDDWLDLSAPAQHLYDVLTTDPELSYCGRVDWRPARLLPRARGWTLDAIHTAAAELEVARFVLFDPDTEEALVRSLIRSDEMLRNPTLGVAVGKAYGSLASRTLRAAVVTELIRIREEHPEYSAWSHSMCASQLSRLLSMPNLEAVEYTNRITDPGPRIGALADAAIALVNTNPISNHIGTQISNTDPVPIANENTNPDRSETPISTRVRNTSMISNPDRSETYPHTSTSTSTHGGYATAVPHVDDSERNDPPPENRPDDIEPSPHCPRHPGGTTERCRACQLARQAADAADAAQRRAHAAARSEAARLAAEDRARAIAACSLCDETGYRDTAVCDHDPDTLDRARRGMAAVKAALAQRNSVDPTAAADCTLHDQDGWRIPPTELRGAEPPRARCDHRTTLPAEWRALIAELLTADTEENSHA